MTVLDRGGKAGKPAEHDAVMAANPDMFEPPSESPRSRKRGAKAAASEKAQSGEASDSSGLHPVVIDGVESKSANGKSAGPSKLLHEVKAALADPEAANTGNARKGKPSVADSLRQFSEALPNADLATLRVGLKNDTKYKIKGEKDAGSPLIMEMPKGTALDKQLASAFVEAKLSGREVQVTDGNNRLHVSKDTDIAKKAQEISGIMARRGKLNFQIEENGGERRMVFPEGTKPQVAARQVVSETRALKSPMALTVGKLDLGAFDSKSSVDDIVKASKVKKQEAAEAKDPAGELAPLPREKSLVVMPEAGGSLVPVAKAESSVINPAEGYKFVPSRLPELNGPRQAFLDKTGTPPKYMDLTSVPRLISDKTSVPPVFKDATSAPRQILDKTSMPPRQILDATNPIVVKGEAGASRPSRPAEAPTPKPAAEAPAVKSDEAAKPVEAAKTVEAAKPVEAAKSDEAAKAVEAAKPVRDVSLAADNSVEKFSSESGFSLERIRTAGAETALWAKPEYAIKDAAGKEVGVFKGTLGLGSDNRIHAFPAKGMLGADLEKFRKVAPEMGLKPTSETAAVPSFVESEAQHAPELIDNARAALHPDASRATQFFYPEPESSIAAKAESPAVLTDSAPVEGIFSAPQSTELTGRIAPALTPEMIEAQAAAVHEVRAPREIMEAERVGARTEGKPSLEGVRGRGAAVSAGVIAATQLVIEATQAKAKGR